MYWSKKAKRERDADIINRAKRWDLEAIDALVYAYREEAIATAEAILDDPQVANIVAREAMFRAIVNLHRFDPAKDTFSTFLATCVSGLANALLLYRDSLAERN